MTFYAFTEKVKSLLLPRLIINIICPFNGKGLEVDGRVLKESLASLDCGINRYSGEETENIAKADINLFCERLAPQFYAYAKLNWLMPNPEWCSKNKESLSSIDLFLCKTDEARRIFREAGKKTYFTGFTTPDIYLPDTQRDYRAFIHVGGSSWLKGTYSLLEAWKSNPQFPRLFLVWNNDPPSVQIPNVTWIQRLPKKELVVAQNRCGIHLCPSEIEGFGHSLMEGMASEAVVLTTAAPPMNEFITDSRFQISYYARREQFMGTCYLASPKALAARVEEILAFPEEELRAIGKNNREVYLENNRQFQENLQHLIRSIRIKKGRLGGK